MAQCCNCHKEIEGPIHYEYPKKDDALVCTPCFTEAGKNLALVPAIRRKNGSKIRG